MADILVRVVVSSAALCCYSRCFGARYRGEGLQALELTWFLTVNPTMTMYLCLLTEVHIWAQLLTPNFSSLLLLPPPHTTKIWVAKFTRISSFHGHILPGPIRQSFVSLSFFCPLHSFRHSLAKFVPRLGESRVLTPTNVILSVVSVSPFRK